jgi:uncharacterized membrane protein
VDDERELRSFDRRHDPTRVPALSDGVFAIALTLLVLEIHVPDLAGGKTLDVALHEVRPSFVAFLISFVVIAITWAGHRDFFTLVRRTDRNLVWLNIPYLLPVSLLPFGAALMASYDREPTALKMYGFLLLLTTLTRLIVWLYVSSRPAPLVRSIERPAQDGGRADRSGACSDLSAGDPHRRRCAAREPPDRLRRSGPLLHRPLRGPLHAAPPGSAEDAFT